MNFLKLKDLGDLKKFIKKNWNKNHIFVKNEKLILWQHLFVKNRLDFFVKKDKNKIIALLGIINQSRDKKYSEISKNRYKVEESNPLRLIIRPGNNS